MLPDTIYTESKCSAPICTQPMPSSKSSQRSPIRIVKGAAAPSHGNSKPATRARRAATQPSKSNSKPPFTAKVCIPHLQFHGDYVIFIVLEAKPPQDVLLSLKMHGAKYRRAPPNVEATMGWHLKVCTGTGEFYHAMKKTHTEFAKQISKCINVIISKSATSQPAQRITGVVKVQ